MNYNSLLDDLERNSIVQHLSRWTQRKPWKQRLRAELQTEAVEIIFQLTGTDQSYEA